MQGNTSRVLEMVRGLRAAPAGEEERAIRGFLRRAKEYGLTAVVTAELALAIAESGMLVPTRQFAPVSSVHSTGAPGSLSTLLAPVLVAACGVYVPLVSVRGSVSGAIDSLAVLPGYNDSLGTEEFLRALATTRLAHVGHTQQVAPADRVLWQLREAEGAKEEPALIAASLLGKKLAVGAVCGSIDVRVGPAGNAGSTPEAAFETAWAVVSAARSLGLRVSCVLSDVTRLPWHRLGRIDSLLSLWEILSDLQWLDHPHVRLCREVAAAACHAASPLIDPDTWRTRVAESLRSGRARETFEASIEAHGARRDALEEVRRQAEGRKEIQVPSEGEPEPASISALFKAIRALMSPETQAHLGVTWRDQERALSVHVPDAAGVDESTVRELAASVQTVPAGAAPIAPRLLRFDGQIQPLAQ